MQDHANDNRDDTPKIRLNVPEPASRAESEMELTPEYGAEDDGEDAEGEEEMSEIEEDDVPMVRTDMHSRIGQVS